jgi:hypothetical protein
MRSVRVLIKKDNGDSQLELKVIKNVEEEDPDRVSNEIEADHDRFNDESNGGDSHYNICYH